MNNNPTFDRFTPQAKSALSSAQQEALRYQHSAIDTEHLLLGLTSDQDNAAVRILYGLGVDPNVLRRTIEARIYPGRLPVEGQVTLTSSAKKVIELAVTEAQRAQQPQIGPEHLLLGLLHEDKGLAATTLKNLGVTLEAVRARIKPQPIPQPFYNPTPSNPTPQSLSERFTPDFGAPQPPAPPINRPPEVVPLDANRQQKALAYRRSVRMASRIYFLVIVILTILVVANPSFIQNFILGWLNMSTSSNVLAWQPIAGWYPLLATGVFLLAIALLFLLTLPMFWYVGAVLPYRYGLRKRKPRQALATFGKVFAVYSIQWYLFFEICTFLFALLPGIWWIVAALCSMLYAIVKARYGTVFLLARFNTITPLPAGDLTTLVDTLTKRLNLPPCAAYQAKISHETDATNAYFFGWGKGRRILFTDTMLQQFSLNEIEVVLAHELAHLVHHDIWKRLFMNALLTTLSLFMIDAFLKLLNAPTTGDLSTVIDPFVLVLLSAIVVIGFSTFSRYIKRRQEYQADEFALQTTGKVQAFKNAMTRLTNTNMVVAANAGKRVNNSATHPTLAKRLQHADEFAARHGISNTSHSN